jgi:acyl carrier protein
MGAVLPAVRAPRFSGRCTGAKAGAASADAADFRDRFAECGPREREELVTRTLTALAASVMQSTPERIDPAANLADLGLDSLMGTELKAALHRVFGCDLPIIEVISAASIDGLSRRVLTALKA